MDPSLLSPEQRTQWAEFEAAQKKRRQVIGKAAKLLGLRPLVGDELNHHPEVCPTCKMDANRNRTMTFVEDDEGKYYRSSDLYEAFVKKFEQT